MPAVKPLVGSNAGRWDVTVTIYAADGTTLATVYSDADGDDVGVNPLPGQRNTGDFGVDTSGNWTCYVVPGDYQVGVRPHGGSETKTPVTVAADVADPTAVLGLVHGVRADGHVPVWNETRQRLEWGSGSAASGAAKMLVYTAPSADFFTTGQPIALTGTGVAATATPSTPDWNAAVGVGSPVPCPSLTAGVYLAYLQFAIGGTGTGNDSVGAYMYAGTVHGNDTPSFLSLSPAIGSAQPATHSAHFALTADDVVYLVGGADNPQADRTIAATLTFIKIADLA